MTTKKTTSKKRSPKKSGKKANSKMIGVNANNGRKKAGSKKTATKIGRSTTRSPTSSGAALTKSSKGRTFLRVVRFWVVRLVLITLVPTLAYTVYLDVTIRKQFEGQKWALPAHVYTRPLELYLGQQFDQALVQAELDELGYVDRPSLDRVGSFKFSQNELAIYQREFRFWDGLRPQQKIRLQLNSGRIQSISIESNSGQLSETEIIRLEPRLFGSVSPMSHEDRTLVKLEDIPQPLIDGLLANEDRHFYSHFGVNPMGIARAMISNMRAGRVVQGGSTLTQQLVKNYYLTSEVTLSRKFTEMLMSILLEFHYSKDEILQAYFNEVYMGQAGNRAIHGFGLASQYFYGRPLHELDLHQLAVLIAVNNGPSFYNPIRHPKRSLKRRDLVLNTMFEQGVIEKPEYDQAINAKLSISPTAASAATLSYPSFMGLVRKDLQADYKQDDLLSAGLQIHTTLNPRIQQTLETAVRSELAAIEKRKGINGGSLQVAAVVIRTDNGEVAAMLGDRNPSFSGFNRALNARRPVGSLLKPFVYLTALESPEIYSLASLVNDQPITVTQNGSPDWQPQNYDGLAHGPVMLIDALARSYNLATVNLGMELGVPRVSNTIRRVGYQPDFSQLPSVLLGAVPMSVVEISQLYLTLASGGFKTPIKSIRSVLSGDNQPLSHYSLDIEQVIEPEFASLINYALQDVVRNGTARSVLTGFQYDYGLAGKTGTTDDYRDSWFAGFSGNYLTVVWVGRDDNKSSMLTGASGAAKIWAKAMQKMPLQRLELAYNDSVLRREVYYSRDPLEQDCSLSRSLPMLVESLAIENIPCANRLQYDLEHDDELQHFEPLPGDPTTPRTKKKSWWERVFG
jgi:penicillin-binding protein 1B